MRTVAKSDVLLQSLRLLVDPTQWFGTSDSSSAVESQPAKALSPRKPEAPSASSAYLKAEPKAKTAEPGLARTSKKKSEAGDKQADQAGSARNANGAGPSEDGLHRLSTHGSAAAGFRSVTSIWACCYCEVLQTRYSNRKM